MARKINVQPVGPNHATRRRHVRTKPLGKRRTKPLSRRLKGVTQDDAIDAAAIVESACPKKWKTKQYIPICKKTAEKFLSELGQRGTSRQGVIDSANATDAWCALNYKTGETGTGRGQYRRVCETVVGGFIRTLAKKRPGLEGRRRR